MVMFITQWINGQCWDQDTELQNGPLKDIK